ncbi:hypothetical protein V8G54_008279 [Vigna mungo]|uniref:Uncharacterized protein n=1 Tax=Vigna mungo TaxID=3915 RepID=A0AAQ3S843_VIGMU
MESTGSSSWIGQCLDNAAEWVKDDQRKQKFVEAALKRCSVAGMEKIDGEIEAQFQTVVFCELGSEMEAEIWMLKYDTDERLEETLKLSLGDLQQEELLDRNQQKNSSFKSKVPLYGMKSREAAEAFLKFLVAHGKCWTHVEDHNWCTLGTNPSSLIASINQAALLECVTCRFPKQLAGQFV